MADKKDEQYFVISCNEDGEPSLTVLSKEKLVEHLNEDYWGPITEVEDLARDLKANDYLDLTEHAGILIIKGRAVQPIAKNVVKEWDI